MVSYSSIATNIFGSLAQKYENSFIFVKTGLSKADTGKSFMVYMSTVFLTTFILAAASAAVSLVLSLLVLKELLVRVLVMMMVPVIVPAGAFVGLLYYPASRGSSREKNIETNLPFVLTHMGSIAESGVPPYVIFRLIGNFDEYGDIAKEFKKIARNIDVYGIDPLTSVRSVADRSPSENLRQTLLGIVTTTESGGNIKTYLKSSGEQALFEWRTRREKFLQQLSTYAELYTGLMVAAPLFMISMFTVMGMISPSLGGFNILDLTKLSVYILIPLVNSAFLMFLRGVEVEI